MMSDQSPRYNESGIEIVPAFSRALDLQGETLTTRAGYRAHGPYYLIVDNPKENTGNERTTQDWIFHVQNGVLHGDPDDGEGLLLNEVVEWDEPSGDVVTMHSQFFETWDNGQLLEIRGTREFYRNGEKESEQALYSDYRGVAGKIPPESEEQEYLSLKKRDFLTYMLMPQEYQQAIDEANARARQVVKKDHRIGGEYAG
jgi:hypothetical protein